MYNSFLHIKPNKLLIATLLIITILGGGYLLGQYEDENKAQTNDSNSSRLGSARFQYNRPAMYLKPLEDVYDPTPPPARTSPGKPRLVEYTLVIEEDSIHEVAPGVKIPAWTFNGTVPGPIIRATEGDTLRVTLVNNGVYSHTIHFHGIHPADMDGVFELLPGGREFVYEFIADPYGVFPYHCHSNPVSQHLLNGLYGMMIIDPRTPRPEAQEIAFIMSAFDTDRDGSADFYSWNGKAFQYAHNPVSLTLGKPVRMYVLNMFEEMMAPHIHANMFGLIPSGTALEPREITDVVDLAITERAIFEFTYKYPGTYMFQCHFSEHMEQGLMGWFNVQPPLLLN